jgi:hypothetical protein
MSGGSYPQKLQPYFQSLFNVKPFAKKTMLAFLSPE